jgi:Spy/CpxP family protein refolding chaperone
MKPYTLVTMAALLGIGIICTELRGQEQAQKEEERPRATREGQGPREGRRFGEEILKRMKEELKLTGEQETQLRQILETARQTAIDWQKEHEEELTTLWEKFRKARENQDTEAMRELGAKFRELFEPQRTVWEDFAVKLKEVLTEEQAAKAQEMLRRRRSSGVAPLSALRNLKLTPEQQAKVNEIIRTARAKVAEIQDPADKRKKMQQADEAAMKKIEEEVLTEEQRRQLDRYRRRMRTERDPGRMYQGLDLSDEQQERINEILQKAATEAAQAENGQDRQEKWRAAHRKIVEEVLTDEQQRKLRERSRGAGRRQRAGSAPQEKGE